MDRHEFIDYFVVGEGEPPLMQILEDPELPRGAVDPGRNLTLSESRKSFVKAEEMPAPDYGDLDVSRYLQLSVASSRGCPFECSFCAETVFWKGYRSLGQSRTFQQMESLAQKYNRGSFYLCDSLSNTTIEGLTFDIRKSNKPFTIDCYLRADKTVSEPEKVRGWREGGLVRSRLGMESASQRILDAMVKKTTPEQMERSLEVLAGAGVITSTLWIVGYPGETEEEFEETRRFIKSNRGRIYQADAWLFQYHPAGLAHSGEIEVERGSRSRYSDHINEILALAPYVVDRDLSPAERFDRLERFVRTMNELEIPNPYSVYEWVAAEGRWGSLGRESHWNVETSMMALNA